MKASRSRVIPSADTNLPVRYPANSPLHTQANTLQDDYPKRLPDRVTSSRHYPCSRRLRLPRLPHRPPPPQRRRKRPCLRPRPRHLQEPPRRCHLRARKHHRQRVAPPAGRVIFHTASPIASLPASREGEFFETNVRGTEALLTVAAENTSAQALVYTSRVDTYADPPHENVTEAHPLWPASDKSNEYNRTKAIADCLVRDANGPQLRTVTLRLETHPGNGRGTRHVLRKPEAGASWPRRKPHGSCFRRQLCDSAPPRGKSAA